MQRFLTILMCLIASVALAATTPNTAINPQTPKHTHLQLTNGNGTTAQTLLTCPTDGGMILGMFATSTDTSNRDIVIQILNTNTYVLTTATITANAGNAAGTAPINLMSATLWPGLPVDLNGNPYFYCQSGDVLQAGALTTITSAKFINVHIVWAGF